MSMLTGVDGVVCLGWKAGEELAKVVASCDIMVAPSEVQRATTRLSDINAPSRFQGSPFCSLLGLSHVFWWTIWCAVSNSFVEGLWCVISTTVEWTRRATSDPLPAVKSVSDAAARSCLPYSRQADRDLRTSHFGGHVLRSAMHRQQGVWRSPCQGGSFTVLTSYVSAIGIYERTILIDSLQSIAFAPLGVRQIQVH